MADNLIWNLHAAIERVDLVVGRLARNSAPGRVRKPALFTVVFVKLLGHIFVLKVGLSIQILGLDIADAIWSRRMQENHIRGEEIILFHANDGSNRDVLPLDLLKLQGCPIPDLSYRFILLSVRLVTLSVFITVLDHRYCDDHHERWQHSRLSI